MDITLEVNILSKKAKEEAYAGNFKKSMKLFEEAYKLLPLEKLKRRIAKMKEMIASERNDDDENSENDDNNSMIDLGENFFLHQSIANQLYSYQKEGVLWFWRLFNKKQGGILGDDMGLGKTIQVIAFLAGMFDAELVHRILIVAPVAVLVNWEKELNKWAGGIRVKTFHGSSKNSRLKNLHSIQKSEGVLLTTYGMIVSNLKSFCQDQNKEDFIWDYIILDEGHKIKNPCKTSKYIRLVPAKFHYILTGTPIQNNLSEMWALFDFTQQGTLLGTEKTFKVEFENPIVKAREKDATSYQQEYGNKLSTRLREIIAPYFLRRTKEEVFKKGSVKQVEAEKILNKLETTKFDLVVWVYLTELQQKLYRGFIQSERVKQTLMSTRSPLAELQLLKKISDHPRLQSTLSKLLTSSEERETRLTIGIDESDNDLEDEEDKVIEIVDDLPIENLIKDSGKMVFLVYLMENLRAENHRTVIFSQSRKMLDIIQRVLSELGHKLLRIDGKMRNPQDREKVLQKFKEDLSFNILLMTTQVGSVGITLTCADRLVIFDPSWNPGTDAQAVDRVYRIGQEKDVIVYRLITCGSIEEKIYRKQIFKNAIMKQTTGASENPYRYFTNLELRELFSLDNPRISTTQLQLQEMHPYLSNSENKEFERHLEFLNNPYIFGVSHHGMLFSHDAVNDITNHEMEDDLQAQVLAAANLISKEFNETEIKLPQRKVQTKRSEYSDSEQLDKNFSEAKHSCTSNFLLNKSINDLECNRDDLCKKILNLSIDNSEDALKSSEETSIAKSPSSFLSNSNRSLQIENITSDIQKMVLKANEVDDIHVKEPVDAYGRKLESVSMPSNYEHLDQNGESLQESSEVANDTDLQISVSHNHYSITKSAETLDCNSSYETVENYSVYEAVDNGCSPISITALNERATPNGKHSELMNEKTNLKEVNYSTVSDEKQASQSYDSIVEQSLTSHDGKEGILLNEIDSELKTSEDDSNLSASIVLNPSQGFYKANATGYNPILAPEVSSVFAIRNLGKLYRTPPVSPMIKKSLLDVSLDNFVNQETSNLATNNMATSTPICAKEHNDFIPNSFNSLKVGKPNITDYIKNKCELIDEDLQNIVAPTLNGCEADHLVSLTELTSEETDSAEKCSQNNIPCSQINNLEKRDKRTEIKRTEDKRTDLVEFSNATSPPKNIFLNSIDLDFLEFGIPSKKVISETNGLIESERSVYFDKESPKSFNVDKGVKIQNIKQPHLKTSRNLISSDTLAGNSEMQYADTLPVNSLCSHDKLKDPTKLLDDDLIQYADTLPVRVSSVVTCVKDNNNYVDTSPLSVSSKFEKTRSSNNKIDLSPTPDYLISDDSSSFDFERSKNSKSLIDKVKSSEFSESSQESVFDFTKNNSTNIDCNRNMTTAIDLEYDDSVQRSELLLLTDLLTQNMGNVNIDDHVLIKIVDLVKKLQLDVQ